MILGSAVVEYEGFLRDIGGTPLALLGASVCLEELATLELEAVGLELAAGFTLEGTIASRLVGSMDMSLMAFIYCDIRQKCSSRRPDATYQLLFSFELVFYEVVVLCLGFFQITQDNSNKHLTNNKSCNDDIYAVSNLSSSTAIVIFWIHKKRNTLIDSSCVWISSTIKH